MHPLLSAAELVAATGPADLSTIRGLLGVILGVGALIFFHELGHFLAAKWRGVRVEVFSLGFGQRLAGFQYGDTDYRISALPLGGYVRMLGQADDDPIQPATDLDEDFRNKKVWERFAILFAGPLANLVLAAIGFMACFGLGVEFTAPQIGTIQPGSAASKADLRPGDIITKIDGKEILGWQDVQILVAVASGPIELEVLRDGKRHTTQATPVRGPQDTFAQLGISPSVVIHDVSPESPLEGLVEQASPKQSTRLLNISPVASQCPIDRRMSTSQLSKALDEAKGKVSITLQHTAYDPLTGLPTGPPKLVRKTVELPRKPEYWLGVDIPDDAYVREVRPDSAAAKAKVEVGDKLVSLGGKQVNWSNLAQTVREVGARADGKPVPLVVERGGKPVRLQVTLELQNPQVVAKLVEGVDDAKAREKIRRSVGNWLLGISYRSDVVGAEGTLTPAEEGAKPIELHEGDRLTSVWTSGGMWWGGKVPFSSDTWLRRMLREPSLRTFKIGWIPKGSKEERTAVVKAVKHPTATYPVLGVTSSLRKVVVARGPLQAVALGMHQTMIQTKRIFLMLRSFLTGSVSPQELGGPIQIVNVAYTVATRDSLARLLQLLAILSVNLAVINLLPIPVLDGGHIFFLLIEKLKGKPVSNDVLIYAQWFGLFCILGLMALVFFNDIRRLAAQ